MGDLSAWLQDNWYELGILLTLMSFVVLGVWFASNVLKTIRTFQEQLGAIVKLSIAASANRPLKNPSPKDALAEGISSWLDAPTINLSKPEGPSRFALACSRLLRWLQIPLHAASAVSWRMVKWLQAPIGN